MARASNVYVVIHGALPISAFTVKHELKKWLKAAAPSVMAAGFRVYRLKDNPWGPDDPQLLTKEDL